ncbi:unnamed protein product [Schistosoma mattheei]|uniref:Uncharacterized protein n=1 Tax=Schistosoma mattheei TaxID=31246 RepID=A0A3P8KQ72_9TREM|nr:unnamed protein product [Schistosoma mattheei]
MVLEIHQQEINLTYSNKMHVNIHIHRDDLELIVFYLGTLLLENLHQY